MNSKVLTLNRAEWELLREFSKSPFKKKYQDGLDQAEELQANEALEQFF